MEWMREIIGMMNGRIYGTNPRILDIEEYSRDSTISK
jgi:hypothetical protein